MNNINKFDKIQDTYSKYRPNYSNDAIDYILDTCNIKNDSNIADIGAGTGKLSRPFLEKGFKVYCIEPNKDMYSKCIDNLKEYDNSKIVLSTAENTRLDDNSIDLIVIGQAFHWFDLKEFKKECNRIMKKDGYIAILYNNGDYTKDVINEIHKASHTYCPNYKGSSGGLYNNENVFNEFFTDYKVLDFENDYKLNLDQFIGLCFSASFAPKSNEPNYDKYLERLKEIFNIYSKDGYLIMPNKTILRIGKI